jgi:tetratricopeptide (TPR) repeat protein/tRNA A-37 threonylcarbamoyl transferase component Bud32
MSKPGDKVKHYEILEQLGKGGMGEVYLAHDTVLDRRVAIKFLPESMQKDEKARVRLLREAKAAASLDHPFICKIYETGEIDGKAYIVMEYVEGKDLREKLEEETPPLRDSLQMILEIAESLEKAHEKGIIHRDLKPSNIMLTPQGHVKVMDFGLAKQILPGGDESSITKTLTQASVTEQGAIVGTLAYMSPEQARGEKIDSRSDIFSLGIILYEMASGKHPFSKPSAVETLSSILRDATPPVSVKPRTVNPLLAPILRKALAKEPGDRYQNIKDLISDIRKLQREIVGGARFLYRGWPVIAGAVVIIALLLTGIWWFVLRGKVGTQGVAIEPISVLITDFQSQIDDPVFDEALEQLLGISLEGAPFISIYDRAQARSIASQLDPSSDGQLKVDLAQLISTREGISVVVDGLIEQSGDGYEIKVWAIDSVKNERIADASRKIKTKSEVGKAVDAISARLRSKLGDKQIQSTQVLAGETFTASSLAAMNAFAKGQEILFLGKREEAIQWFEKALDNDPNLGRAYVSLGTIYSNLQQHDKAEEYYQMAFARIGQMSEREKHRTQGSYYIIKKNYPKAIEEFTALLEKYPADSVGYMNLALAYFYAREMAKAAEVGRQAVELYPKDVTKRFNLVWYLIGAGDFETAEEEVHKVIQLDPAYKEAYVCKALIEINQGQMDQAAETYRQLKTRDSYGAALAATGMADLAAIEGRISDAITILLKGVKFDLENGHPFIAADKYITLSQMYMLQGKKDLAVEAANNAVGTFRREEFLFSAAEIYVQNGLVDKARNLAAELSKKVQPDHRVYAKLIGGELSMARGDVPGAIQIFLEAQAIADTWYGRYLLGRAYLEAEYFSEAYSEFELCLKRRGEATSVHFNDLPTYRYLPPVYYYLGRAQEGLKSPAAKDSYETFLLIKEKGEADWMVEDARKRLGSD